MSILVIVQKGDNIAKIETLNFSQPEGKPLVAFETSTLVEAILVGTDVTLNPDILQMIEQQNTFAADGRKW